MASNISSLKTVCDNVIAVTKAAIKKEPLYLNAKFERVTNVQQKASVQELFLELGKMYVTSTDSDKDATVSTIVGGMKLITQNQETPEIYARSAAIIDVVSKAFQHLKAVFPKDQPAFVQKALSSLLVGKEAMILTHRTAESRRRVDIADVDRNRYFTWMARRPDRGAFDSEYHPSSSVREAASKSLEAFSLLFSMHNRSGNYQIRMKDDKIGLYLDSEMRRFTPFVLEKLRTCSESADPHVRTVAQAYLSWFEFAEAETEDRRLGKELQEFNKGGKVNPFARESILQQCMPEFTEMWAANMEYLLRIIEEKIENPNDEDVDPAFTKQQLTYWPRFKQAAESRHFLYDFFYQLLGSFRDNAVKQREFIARYYKHISTSILHPISILPEPAVFSALSVEKSVAVVSPPIAAAVSLNNKDQKTPSVPPQKKPPKKDPFFAHFPKEPPAKTEEPPSTAAATSQTAAAASDPHPLASVFAAGSAFIANKTYAERASIWLTDPASAVESPNYQNLPAENKEAAKWRHGFTTALDQFLGTRYSTKGLWQNPTTGKIDTLHCMVGEVEDENGNKKRCVLQYCEDQKHVIYHRYAGLTSNQGLLDLVINQKLFEVLDFPALKVSQNAKQSGKSAKPIPLTVEGAKVTVDPQSDIVTVHDNKYKKTFRLIPLGD